MVNNASVKLAVTPAYPKRALKNNIDGEVTVEFTISPYGRAVDAEIIAAQPPRVFNNTVLDALRFWTFVPARPVACGTVPQTARQTFRFRSKQEKRIQLPPIEIEGQPTLPRGERRATLEEIHAYEQFEQALSQVVSPRGLVVTKRVPPEYPQRALERRLEGMVAVTFLVEKDGSVTAPKVAHSVRGSQFRGAALRAIRQWRFEPSYRDGRPVERTGCHEFIFLVDEYVLAQKRLERMKKTNMEVYTHD